jgi:hypothetical protein
MEPNTSSTTEIKPIILNGIEFWKGTLGKDGYKFIVYYNHCKALVEKDLNGFFSYTNLSEATNTFEDCAKIYETIEKLIAAQNEPISV